MEARPILMSAPMVRALLAGTKTQTRRIVKPKAVEAIEFLGGRCDEQPMTADDFSIEWRESIDEDSPPKKYPPQWCVRSAEYPEEGVIPIGHGYGNVGDLMYVKENWAYRLDHDEYNGTQLYEMGVRQAWYWADGPGRCCNTGCDGAAGRVRSGRFMPRWASRITLRITEVRVERLQEISEADCWAEGIERSKQSPGQAATLYSNFATPRLAYMHLWESINGAESWTANPWVWCVSFEVMRENVDQVLRRTA